MLDKVKKGGRWGTFIGLSHMEISREQIPVLYLGIGMRKMVKGISLEVDIFLEGIKVELAINLELFLS